MSAQSICWQHGRRAHGGAVVFWIIRVRDGREVGVDYSVRLTEMAAFNGTERALLVWVWRHVRRLLRATNYPVRVHSLGVATGAA